MEKRNFANTFGRFLKKWRWIKWKLFLIWAVLIAVALVFVILPLLLVPVP